VPKRDSERIRRNKPDIDTTVIEMIGSVEPPALGIENPHPITEDFYYSLVESGQSKYYEPSDWQYARLCFHFVDQLLKSGKPSSMILQQVNSMLGDLLVAEGQRRRVRMEIERDTPAPNNVIEAGDVFRQRFGVA
jgi:hypothetical protein